MIVGSTKKKTVTTKNEANEITIPGNETIEQQILALIESRDYSGASAVIEFSRDELGHAYTKELALWHGYSLFHLGDYQGAIEVYEKLLKEDPEDTVLYLYISSCQYYLRDFDDARASAMKGPQVELQTRLLFHISHQLNDEQELFSAHSKLVGTLENQLSLAAIHYMRSHYQEAIEIYQKILQEHEDYLALNVYISMCQFKLDKFEESNEYVDQYLGVNSDSAVALNLKSCDYLRLYGSEIAESQLLQIRKFAAANYDFVDALINHNLCIFKNGEDGFKILPKLISILPEARFNLAIQYMKESNSAEAYNILQGYQSVDVPDSILKASVDLAYGQYTGDSGPIEEANLVFKEVGDMDTVRDTIPGRQAKTTHHFIQGEYDLCLKLLDTIETFIGQTDEFYYNKAMALAALSKFEEAERLFLSVQNPAYTKEIYYVTWLAKCYIMNKKPENAWKLYTASSNTEEAKTLLQIISVECFNTKAFYYAMKAYDVLCKFELDPSLKQGMIASAIGVFRNILSRKETSDKLSDVIEVLSSEPEAAQVLQTIQNHIDTSTDFDNLL